MPRGFSDEQMTNLHQKLVEVAFEKLHNTGIRKTTVEDLARAANISTGAFYKFHPSKEALFFDVYEIAEEKLKMELMTVLQNQTQITKQDLQRACRELIKSETMQTLLQLMRKDELEYMLRNIAPDRVASHLKKDEEFLHSLFETLRSKNLNLKNDASLLISYLQALFVLCYEKKNFEPFSDSIIDAFLDTIIDQFID